VSIPFGVQDRQRTAHLPSNGIGLAASFSSIWIVGIPQS
jgi:hypothetical protein